MTRMVTPHAPTPTPAECEQEQERHRHRLDLTPAMLAADSDFVERPADLFADLSGVYSPEFLRELWRDAGVAFGEQWRPVEGYADAYAVSDLGRVRSLARRITDFTGRCIRSTRDQVLKPRLDSHGYLVVTLWREGKQQSVWVSRMVAAAFLGPCPPGLHVAHGDGNPQHNRPSNLRYATRKENEADKIVHGTRLRGEGHPFARLTAEDACAVVRRFHAGETSTALARDFNTSTGHVSHIVHGKAWGHVTAELRAELSQSSRGEVERKPKPRRGFGSVCGNGHLLDEKNGRVDALGRLRCRACARDKSRKYAQAKRDAALTELRGAAA